MECKVKNDIGTIFITEDVLLKVAGYAALECYGIVAMSSKRATDGIVEWLGRENLAKGVQIRSVDDALEVDLFIIVEYGISISACAATVSSLVPGIETTSFTFSCWYLTVLCRKVQVAEPHKVS